MVCGSIPYMSCRSLPAYARGWWLVVGVCENGGREGKKKPEHRKDDTGHYPAPLAADSGRNDKGQFSRQRVERRCQTLLAGPQPKLTETQYEQRAAKPKEERRNEDLIPHRSSRNASGRHDYLIAGACRLPEYQA